MLGLAISFSSLFRFPYLFYENSSAFLVPYFIVLCLIAIPMFQLENAFGQRQSKCQTFCNLFNAVDEHLWGISYLQVLYSTLFNMYHFAIMFYSGSLFYKSLESQSPLTQIRESGMEYFDIKNGYFDDYKLDQGHGIGKEIPPLVLTMFVCAVVVFASVWKGINF